MHYFSYNENKSHGSAAFPVDYFYVDENHPSYSMPFHWHKEWEIIRVRRGEMQLYADDREYRAGAGDVFLLREGTLHGSTPRGCIYECFNFDPDLLFANVRSVRDDLRPFLRGELLPTLYYPSGFSGIHPVVEELLTPFRTRQPESHCRLMTFGNLSRLFALILDDGCYTESLGVPSKTTAKITQLKPVLEYIETHFSEPLTLETLAKIIGMNPKYFCRFFQSITKLTPMNYVNYYRVEEASNLLCNTGRTVTEIGFECGFNDTCHFIKTFKKHKGTTPKQYQLALSEQKNGTN